MSGEIKLFTRWRVEGNLPEIAAILGDAGGYAQWWPEAWTHSEEIDPGDATGAGSISTLTPKWQFPGGRPLSLRLVVDDRPQSWAVEVNGDLSGRGTWTLYQDGPVAEIGLEWRVLPSSLRLRLFGPIGRSVVRSTLRRLMRSGEAALAAEVIRRRSHRSG